MRIRSAWPWVVGLFLVASSTIALVASTAFAMTPGPSNPPPPPSGQPGIPSVSGSGSGPPTARQEAEQSYALAYEEVGKAKKDLEEGKAKNAGKKFRRALERCEKAVSYDERYHEAWNLLGYTARKLGDYDKAFKAYDRCLALKPDYAPAREYLGEAWLEKGDAAKARTQLLWLERLEAVEEAKALRSVLAAWAAAHPDSTAPPAVPPAHADSATAGSGTSGR